MQPQAHPVVVVGAGVAGLIAARQLSQHFSDVLVVEAAPRIGGRLQEVRMPALSSAPAMSMRIPLSDAASNSIPRLRELAGSA